MTDTPTPDEIGRVLQHLQEEAYRISAEHGFHEDDEAPALALGGRSEQEAFDRLWAELQDSKRLQLIGDELSEAHEELRSGHTWTEVYYDGDKPEGFSIELADAQIRIWDLAQTRKVDLASAVLEKMAFNETRPRKHGRRY
jgi:hypothetical protein